MNKEVKFYYVYLITNKITSKKYIGSKMCYKEDPLNDGYMGSSKHLNEDYQIYGIKNFSKEIIKDDYKNKRKMLEGESYYMHEYNTFEPMGYNRYDPIKRPGFHGGGYPRFKGWHHSEETKKKISNAGKIAQLGHIVTEETRKKIGIGNSKSLSGIKFSEERKIKMRGWHHSEEAKQKIGISSKNSGRYTKERSLKIWESRRKNGKGKMSDEAKRKISEFWKEKRFEKI